MNENNFSTGRYSRFVNLPTIGVEGMKKIRRARVSIVGAGGLGSVTATQLTALGVGHLRLFDKDIVELSNLQRQMLYREKDVGKPKVNAAKKFLEKLNPDVKIEIIQEEVSTRNVDLVTDNVDFVIDALDRFTSRFAINKKCLESDIPFLFGAVSGLAGNVMTVVRGGACIECLFGHIDDNALPSSAETGIHPSIIQLIGSLQIAEATRVMLKEKPLLTNRLLFIDIGSMLFDSIKIKSRNKCSNAKYH